MHGRRDFGSRFLFPFILDSLKFFVTLFALCFFGLFQLLYMCCSHVAFLPGPNRSWAVFFLSIFVLNRHVPV